VLCKLLKTGIVYRSIPIRPLTTRLKYGMIENFEATNRYDLENLFLSLASSLIQNFSDRFGKIFFTIGLYANALMPIFAAFSSDMFLLYPMQRLTGVSCRIFII
jgi:hypothetical protein